MRNLLPFLLLLLPFSLVAQSTEHSVARQWNEQLLRAIRADFARPVVHARNLYHSSAAMYDAWALVYGRGETALMGRLESGYLLEIDLEGIPTYPDRRAAAEQAISYAAYRLLLHRYTNAPGVAEITTEANALMDSLGFDPNYTATDYVNGPAAALGNHIAQEIINFGMRDGANERNDYANVEYPDPVNPPLLLDRPFSILQVVDPNHWQPLAFPGTVVDQSGNPIGSIPGFLGASWGRVHPFALPEAAKTTPTGANPIYGNSPVYYDPGPPPYYNLEDTAALNLYRWNFELVLKWSSHLDPADSVRWDISPGALGNNTEAFPTDLADHRQWYELEGGQPGNGHPLNPATGEPYPDNVVLRGDYTRVLAEFWADGPDSETPPGHWFVIFNKVMDHPEFERRLFGEGEVLDALQYDVKAYLALGGAMHDAAITAWSIKGAYDYVRPITAIRYLATQGQASVEDNRYYDPGGIRLDSGYIELVESSDEVVNPATLMTVKAKAWIGNSFIDDATIEQAGVDWINPSIWEPYQRPNFVTPNFAGYVSGHSTFSSAAATVLENLTGSPYFPGGVGEFVAKKNEFLVFEEGPSEDVVLQWATYRDASNETSLSRIWGGIHPPADDIPGRIIGVDVGTQAYLKAQELFGENSTATEEISQPSQLVAFPNPVRQGEGLRLGLPEGYPTESQLILYDLVGRELGRFPTRGPALTIPTDGLLPGIYLLRGTDTGLTAKIQVH